jgi:hypothetical protein
MPLANDMANDMALAHRNYVLIPETDRGETGCQSGARFLDQN